MKRINAYRKLFGADAKTDLKQLKHTYRNLVKEWHPDKFQAGDEKAVEAELKSQQIIDGYHFLVSIAPETIEAKLQQIRAITHMAQEEMDKGGNPSSPIPSGTGAGPYSDAEKEARYQKWKADHAAQ